MNPFLTPESLLLAAPIPSLASTKKANRVMLLRNPFQVKRTIRKIFSLLIEINIRIQLPVKISSPIMYTLIQMHLKLVKTIHKILMTHINRVR